MPWFRAAPAVGKMMKTMMNNDENDEYYAATAAGEAIARPVLPEPSSVAHSWRFPRGRMGRLVALV